MGDCVVRKSEHLTQLIDFPSSWIVRMSANGRDCFPGGGPGRCTDATATTSRAGLDAGHTHFVAHWIEVGPSADHLCNVVILINAHRNQTVVMDITMATVLGAH